MAQTVLNGTAGDNLLDASGFAAADGAIIRAGDGADTLLGGAGADRFDGGTGADSMVGGGGNDQFFVSLDRSFGDAPDSIDGGSGNDLLVFAASASQITPTVVAEIARLAVHQATDPGGAFGSAILDVQFTGIETVQVRLDGTLRDLSYFVAAPDAKADSYAGITNTPLLVDAAAGLLANDAAAVPLQATAGSFATTLGGSVTIAADGSFGYVPLAGVSGTDSFDYTVTDSFGRSTTATAAIAVAPLTGGRAIVTAAGVFHDADGNGEIGAGEVTEVVFNGARKDADLATQGWTIEFETDTQLIDITGFSADDKFAIDVAKFASAVYQPLYDKAMLTFLDRAGNYYLTGSVSNGDTQAYLSLNVYFGSANGVYNTYRFTSAGSSSASTSLTVAYWTTANPVLSASGFLTGSQFEMIQP